MAKRSGVAGGTARGLFAVAEAYCRARLAEEPLSSRGNAELTLELSRTLAAHAVQSPPELRDALWAAASTAIDGFLRQHADHPRAFVLRLQDGLVAQGRGELAVREAELLPGDATLRPAAQKFLREAIGRLTVLRDDVAAALRKAPRSPVAVTDSDAISADELVSLERNVRYQIAKAQQEIAETYPAGNDRVDALAQADKLLEPLAGANSEDEVVWQARVDRVAVDRKLGRAGQAQQRIEQLAERARPAWVDARLFVERALLAAAGGDHDAGLKFLDAAELTAGGISDAERDDLRLDVVLGGWRMRRAMRRWQRHDNRRPRNWCGGLPRCTGLTGRVAPSCGRPRRLPAAPARTTRHCWPARRRTFCIPAERTRRFELTIRRPRRRGRSATTIKRFDWR